MQQSASIARVMTHRSVLLGLGGESQPYCHDKPRIHCGWPLHSPSDSMNATPGSFLRIAAIL